MAVSNFLLGKYLWLPHEFFLIKLNDVYAYVCLDFGHMFIEKIFTLFTSEVSIIEWLHRNTHVQVIFDGKSHGLILNKGLPYQILHRYLDRDNYRELPYHW